MTQRERFAMLMACTLLLIWLFAAASLAFAGPRDQGTTCYTTCYGGRCTTVCEPS